MIGKVWTCPLFQVRATVSAVVFVRNENASGARTEGTGREGGVDVDVNKAGGRIYRAAAGPVSPLWQGFIYTENRSLCTFMRDCVRFTSDE